MSISLNDLKVYELELLLGQKRQVYDQMIRENKEFEEVKQLFDEIRDLEKKLQQNHEGINASIKHT